MKDNLFLNCKLVNFDKILFLKMETASFTGLIKILLYIIIVYYINQYLLELIAVTIYMLLFVCGPLVFFTIKIWTAKSKKEFHVLSSVLKWILFFGILSLLVISVNMKYNA